MAILANTSARLVFMRWSMTDQGMKDCRSITPIVSIARPVTSSILTRSSNGLFPRMREAPNTRGFNDQIGSSFKLELQGHL